MLSVRGQEILTTSADTSLCFYTVSHTSLHQNSQNECFLLLQLFHRIFYLKKKKIWTVQAVGSQDGPSSVLLVQHGTLVCSSRSVSPYMPIWHHGKKKDPEQISQLFLNTVCGFVSVIPMSPELSVEFPITLNGSKSLSGPSDTARKPSDVSAFLADRKYSQLFYPHIPRNKCQKLNVQDTEQKLSNNWTWSLPEQRGNRLNQQSTEMSEKIWCPFNDVFRASFTWKLNNAACVQRTPVVAIDGIFIAYFSFRIKN